jgi:hypothetical protein
MFAVTLAFLWGCERRSQAVPAGQQGGTTAQVAVASEQARVRTPAVAGFFYPADKRVLSDTLDGFLDRAPVHYIPRLRALICPHAGYEFSGPIASVAYRAAMGRTFETVIVMGPSHYAAFQQASIPDADYYQTPLGDVAISEKAQALVKAGSLVVEPRCLVQRPDWWRQSQKPVPALGAETPETWEHSVEVQVPFLQKALKHFKLLPVVVGDADPEKLAAALAPILDDKTLVVASSDLSHYYPYDEARTLDSHCVQAICKLDLDDMKHQEACGRLPILALMRLARLKGWQARLLDCRNSGDTSGKKDRVVGYAAIAFYEPVPAQMSEADRKFLLDVAHQSLFRAASNGPPPEVNLAQLPPSLSSNRGCFVTLTLNGQLRGCIGNLLPQEALYTAVKDNTRNAALHDPRFPPVRPDEVERIHIEISVLTVPQPMSFTNAEDLASRLRPYEDGVVLRIGSRSATFLPQVWAEIPDTVTFLNQLSLKAGFPPDAWRNGETSVSTYHVESFEDSE